MMTSFISVFGQCGNRRCWTDHASIDQFDSERTLAGIDLPQERLGPAMGSWSFSLHFGPEFSGKVPTSVALTALLEGPSPSANTFVEALSSTEPKPTLSCLPERQAFPDLTRPLQREKHCTRCRSDRLCQGQPMTWHKSIQGSRLQRRRRFGMSGRRTPISSNPLVFKERG